MEEGGARERPAGMLLVSLRGVNYGFWYPLRYRQYFVFGGGGGGGMRKGRNARRFSYECKLRISVSLRVSAIFCIRRGGGGGGACEMGGMLVVSLMSVNYGFQYPSGYQQYFVFGGGGGGNM